MCAEFATAARDEGRSRAAQKSAKRKRLQQPAAARPMNRQPAPNRRRVQYNPIEARRLQIFYRLSKKRAMRTILTNNNVQYTGSTENATSYFTGVYQPQLIDMVELDSALKSLIPTTNTNTDFLTPLSNLDIQKKLSSMANSAPGKDKVEYNHLKLIDPDAEILRVIYNRCLLANRIPAAWKEATTILIHKKGPSDDPANFRPIALIS